MQRPCRASVSDGLRTVKTPATDSNSPSSKLFLLLSHFQMEYQLEKLARVEDFYFSKEYLLAFVCFFFDKRLKRAFTVHLYLTDCVCLSVRHHWQPVFFLFIPFLFACVWSRDLLLSYHPQRLWLSRILILSVRTK